MTDVPVVAIDGPTASGKGTIAQRVADALRFNYLDSGALYRLVALRALQEGIGAEDADRLSPIASAIAPTFAGGRITLDGNDVTDAIRSEAVSQFASRIAVLSGVRRALLICRDRTPVTGPGCQRGVIWYHCLLRPTPNTAASVPARAERRLISDRKGFSANTLPFAMNRSGLIRSSDLRYAQRAHRR